MNFAEIIKEKIKSKGLKQSFLAEKLNISNQSLYYKLSNNIFYPDEIFKIAKILGINLNQFKEA